MATLTLRTTSLIALLLWTSTVQSNEISGLVRDKHTLLPVSGAAVSLVEAGGSGTTDSDGRFSLASDLPAANASDTLVVSDGKYWEKRVAITTSTSSDLEIDLQASKHRLIVTTDIGGGDPDDLQSLVHALLLSNEFELEGIICGHAWVDSNLERGKDRVQSALDAYEKVFPSLKIHAAGYPSPDYLRSIVKLGQAEALMSGVGVGKDSDGSNLIVDAVDRKEDPRPVWLNAWGGANTIAQSFWKVKNTRTPEEVEHFVNKIRVYDILGQCDGGSWVAKNFPNSTYIRNSSGVYGWAPSKAWTAENVQNHGPLGEIYPTAKWATEGDSPAFLHLSSRGLNDPDELAQGGWGGRFGPEKKTGVKLFSWAERTASVNAHDQKLRPYALYTNTSEGTDSIRKWQSDIHNSLAARMDWSVTENRNAANHFPIAVLNGDKTRQILEMEVEAGDEVQVDATASSDPDGDSLEYSWQFYQEASSYLGQVSILGGDRSAASITIPDDASGAEIHIVLVIHDDGSPSLAAYRRLILTVK